MKEGDSEHVARVKAACTKLADMYAKEFEDPFGIGQSAVALSMFLGCLVARANEPQACLKQAYQTIKETSESFAEHLKRYPETKLDISAFVRKGASKKDDSPW